MKKILFILIISILVQSCEESSTSNRSFDKTRILTEYAQNYIIPNLREFRDNITVDLASIPNQNAFSVIRAAQNNWQDVAFLNFGPANSFAIKSGLDRYPADTARVAINIEDIDKTSYSSAADAPAVSFSAMDFVIAELYEGDDKRFSNEELFGYLDKVFDYHADVTNSVLTEWETSYRDEFISNDGNTANSSLTNLVNEYIRFYEKDFRDFKLAVPLGIRSNGLPLPHRVEMPYSGISWQVFQRTWQAIYNFYFNIGEIDGYGLADLLRDQNVDGSNGQKVHIMIEAQFEQLDTKINNYVPINYQDALVNDVEALNNIYQDVQKLVALLKVDMTSALGIQITYDSNDGD